MKLLVVFLLASYTSFSFANNTFGDVSKTSFGRPDQSGCTSEAILENVMNDVDIDIIEGKVTNIWECKKGQGAYTARTRRCPYDQDMKDEAYSCFSNRISGFPYVCVSGTRSDIVIEDYVSDGKDMQKKVPKARFSQLFVFQSEKNETNFKMDQKGCNAEEVLGDDNLGYGTKGTTKSVPDECLKLLGNLTTGENSTGNTKFCGGSTPQNVSDQLYAVKKLYHCYEAFPNLDELFKIYISRSRSSNSENNSAKRQ